MGQMSRNSLKRLLRFRPRSRMVGDMVRWSQPENIMEPIAQLSPAWRPADRWRKPQEERQWMDPSSRMDRCAVSSGTWYLGCCFSRTETESEWYVMYGNFSYTTTFITLESGQNTQTHHSNVWEKGNKPRERQDDKETRAGERNKEPCGEKMEEYRRIQIHHVASAPWVQLTGTCSHPHTYWSPIRHTVT